MKTLLQNETEDTQRDLFLYLCVVAVDPTFHVILIPTKTKTIEQQMQ